MKKFSMEITNEVILNTDGLSIIEIHNAFEHTYDYYLYKEGYPLAYSHGVSEDNRESSVGLIVLYGNRYFRPIIEESFN